MNNQLHQAIFGTPKVRKTWKNSLSAEKNAARLEQMRFCKQVRKLLGDDYQVEFHFNPGGVMVWGETFVHIFRHEFTDSGPLEGTKTPIVEACLSVTFSYIRQWDGRGSGKNHAISYGSDNVGTFVDMVRRLAERPFVRF